MTAIASPHTRPGDKQVCEVRTSNQNRFPGSRRKTPLFPRANLIERTKAGIRRARAQGKQIGRTPQFYVDDNKIAELLAAGKNAFQVMKILGAPRTTIYRKVAALKASAARTGKLEEPPHEEFRATDDDLPTIFFQETR